MICQRCGICCVTMPVIINVDGRAKAKPHDKACPHLQLVGLCSTICTVHAEPWYEGSPCHTYGNSDVDPDFANKRGLPCPVGMAIKDNGGLKKHSPGLVWAKPEELEDYGEWPEETRVQGRGSDGSAVGHDGQGHGEEDERAP